MVQFLLDVQGVDVNFQNKYRQTPLIAPAKDGHETLVELLLDQPGIGPDVSERFRIRARLYGQTSLSCAAMNGHVNIVRALLATGRMNVESRDTQDWTPLTYAAVKGRDAVVEALITLPRIQLDSRERWGYTPLMWAAMEGHETVARQEGGHAAAKGHKDIAKLLLDKGCNPVFHIDVR
jgi:ankyrin repeat protein